MNEMELKYGCNPNQKPARVFMNDNKDLPFQVLSGRPMKKAGVYVGVQTVLCKKNNTKEEMDKFNPTQ